MLKNYSLLVLLVCLHLHLQLVSQEVRIFTTNDFDLRGNVKSCLVSTNYGKEEYDFDEKGLLTKAVTRYNETDYSSTSYLYIEGALQEKRFENYRDNELDKATSIANLYEYDTIKSRKITEQIISYDKEFLDQYEYHYNADEQLNKIVRANNDGVDETLIAYSEIQEEKTQTYTLNDEIQESIRTSSLKAKNDSVQTTVLTKKFLNGSPSTAVEEVFESKDKLLVKTIFRYDQKAKQFQSEQSSTYFYSSEGVLEKAEIKTEAGIEIQEYSYQFDPQGNWIKEIIGPENTYTTRKIEYYPIEEIVEEN